MLLMHLCGRHTVDLKRHGRMLAVLRDNYGRLLNHSWGDKETFWMAAELASARYAVTPFDAGHVLARDRRCLYHVHYAPDETPIFVHGEKSAEGWTKLGEPPPSSTDAKAAKYPSQSF